MVDQVEARVNAPPAPGFDGQVAWRQINRDMGRTFALDLLRAFSSGRSAEPGSGNGAFPAGLGSQGATVGRSDVSGGMPPNYGFGMGLRLANRDQLLGRSSFALNRATSDGGLISFWSRSARSSFAGQDGALALSGDVRSTMYRANYSKGQMVTGVSASRCPPRSAAPTTSRSAATTAGS